MKLNVSFRLFILSTIFLLSTFLTFSQAETPLKQKENSGTDEKKSINPTHLKVKDLEKPKKIRSKQNTSTKESQNEELKTDASLDGKDYPIRVFHGTKRNEQKPEIKTDNNAKEKSDATERSSKPQKKRGDSSDKEIFEKAEIKKEINNDKVILTLPNRNIQSNHADEYSERVKNHYDVISKIVYFEEKNNFKIIFSDNKITEKSELLSEILIHFNIQEYTIKH
ncbi:MAG: hypothetical protein WED10_02460 [Brumimicrobium sp.]